MKPNPGKIFPPGHFYSPIPDLNEIEKRKDSIFKLRKDEEILGLNINKEEQLQWLHKIADYFKDFPFPLEKPAEDYNGYFLNNGLFEGLDGVAYFAFIRELQPVRIIEVEAGYSSILAMETNRRFFNGKIEVTLIEPFPSKVLSEYLSKHPYVTLIEKPVQDLEASLFESLQENDILFIDSTHVAKVGSDVNFLIFEVLPRLKKSVWIHFHDIFIPDEYPQKWVFEENRAWNEMYILKAFLMYNEFFKICFSSYYVYTRFKDDVINLFRKALSGGSIWIRKVR